MLLVLNLRHHQILKIGHRRDHRPAQPTRNPPIDLRIQVKKLTLVVAQLLVQFPLQSLDKALCTCRTAGDYNVSHYRRFVIGTQALDHLVNCLVDSWETFGSEQLVGNCKGFLSQNQVAFVG